MLQGEDLFINHINHLLIINCSGDHGFCDPRSVDSDIVVGDHGSSHRIHLRHRYPGSGCYPPQSEDHGEGAGGQSEDALVDGGGGE